VRKLFTGAEMAGIKFHGAIDVEISHNHIYRTCRGLWLDWMAQGTHVSGNLFHDNDEDFFVEVDHGPFLMDNNLFLSPSSEVDRSQGGAYVHNLFTGSIKLLTYDARQTPYLEPHSTQVAGYHDNPNGDDRYVNNLFVGSADLSIYNNAPLPMWMEGNVFLKGAKPSKFEKDDVVKPDVDPAISLAEGADGVYLEITYDPAWTAAQPRSLVTSNLLGKAVIPNAPYEQPDGQPICINTDYLGRSRNESSPTPGPFENPGQGALKLKVW
jgi:alpha-N-arabinofuranosidase